MSSLNILIDWMKLKEEDTEELHRLGISGLDEYKLPVFSIFVDCCSLFIIFITTVKSVTNYSLGIP